MSEVLPQLPLRGDGCLAVVGEAPGPDEEREGKPFAGSGGRLLGKLMGNAGIIRDICYMDNVVRVRPPNNKWESLSKEVVEAGGRRIREDLAKLHPSVVVTLGAKALEGVCPNYPKRLMELQGLPIQHDDGYVVVPTLHPSFLLRGQLEFAPQVKHDLQKALRYKKLGWKRKDRSLSIYPTVKEMEVVTQMIHAQRLPIAFDLETTRSHRLLCAAVAWSPSEAIVFHLNRDEMSEEDFKLSFDFFAALMRDEAVPKVGHNIFRFDLPMLQTIGIQSQGVRVDTMVAWHDCFPLWRKALTNLASHFTDEPYWKGECRVTDEDTKTWDMAYDDTLWRMNALDTCITYEAWQGIEGIQGRLGVQEIYKHDHQCGLLAKDMAMVGLRVNKAGMVEEKKRREQEIKDAQLRLEVVAREKGMVPEPPKLTKKGKPRKTKPKPLLNVKSSQQVKAFIKERLHLNVPRDKHGKETVNAMQLLEMARVQKQPILRDIVLLSKKRTRSSFFSPKLREGRLHAGYNVAGQKAGRWAGEQSFLGGRSIQNWPKDSRFIFVPDEEWVAVEVDKKQSEAVIVAHKAYLETGDSSYLDLLARVDKVHLWLGRELCKLGIFDFPPEEFSAEKVQEYLTVKKGVHGSSYGLGPLKMSRAIAKDTDGLVVVPVAVTRAVQRTFFQFATSIPRWQQATFEWLRQSPELMNPFGRKIWLLSSKGQEKGGGENLPLAWFPQSTCVDDINSGALRMIEARLPVRFHAQLHDGLWLQIHKSNFGNDILSEIRKLLYRPFIISRYDGEQHMELAIDVEIKFGENFGKGLNEWLPT